LEVRHHLADAPGLIRGLHDRSRIKSGTAQSVRLGKVPTVRVINGVAGQDKSSPATRPCAPGAWFCP